MAIRSGLAGQVGFASETTYGTYAAVDHFVEADVADLKDTSVWAQGSGIAAGRMQQLGSRRIRTQYGAQGTIQHQVSNKGLGPLLQALMGTSVTPTVVNTSTGYKQTHTFADPFGKSLSVQTGIPDLTGTVRPYNFLGCKVQSAEFKCNSGEMLNVTWNFIGREVEESDTLVAASYPSSTTPFSFLQSTIKVGTYGSEASVSGIRGMSCMIARTSREDRFYHGSGAKMAEPIINDYQPITGAFDVDFMDKTVFADKFQAGTAFSLVWEFVGASLGGSPGVSELFRITLPQVHLTGDTPTLNGPDIITGSFPFEATFDGTHQPLIEYISVDTTL